LLEIAITSRRVLRLEYLLLDVNGTIALDGQPIPGVRERLDRLSETLGIWLVSADTQGTLAALAASLKVKTHLLQPGDEAAQKAALVQELGAERVIALGNGANDAAMLHRAALGIAVMGGEGLTAADVVTPNIESALDLLLYPRRLVATLRA